MVGILWLEERAERKDNAPRLIAIGGILTAAGFGIAGTVGFEGHPWSGWPLVAFLAGFVLAAVGLIDVIAGLQAFEFRTGPEIDGEATPDAAPPKRNSE